MANVQLGAVLRHVRGLAAALNSESQSDGALLRTFAAANNQAAFTAIVKRHEALVLAVCRRVLHNIQDAEDAFQATFLLLARNAASIRKQESLAGWLHAVAYRMAKDARRAAFRRERHERRAGAMRPTTPDWDVAWREVQAVLDEEIQRLPLIYRDTFVLCYMENKSGADAARALGVREGTVGSRLAKARALMRQALARRGVSLSAVLAAAALSATRAGAGMSPSLLTSTIDAATLIAAGKPLALGAVSAKVAALLEGAKTMSLISNLKTTAMMIVLLTLVATGVGLGAQHVAWSGPAIIPEERATDGAPACCGRTESSGIDQEKKDEGTSRILHLDGVAASLTWSPSGKLLAIRTSRWEKGGPAVELWDVETGKRRLSFGEIKKDGLWSVTFSPDSTVLAISSRSEDGDLIELRGADKGDVKTTVPMKNGLSPLHLAFALDGKSLFVPMKGGARVCDLQTKKLRELVGHPSKGGALVYGMALASDGKTLATSATDRRIVIWDTKREAIDKVLEWPDTLMVTLAFSPDGETLASGGGHSTLLLWDVKKGAMKRALLDASEYTGVVTFGDNAKLATAGFVAKDGTRTGEVKLWDARSGKLLRAWTGAVSSCVAFSPDGQTLAIAFPDRTVRLWKVNPESRSP